MDDERDIFEDMTEQERIDAAPLLMELGAIIDVAEGNGNIMGVIDDESARMAEELV